MHVKGETIGTKDDVDNGLANNPGGCAINRCDILSRCFVDPTQKTILYGSFGVSEPFALRRDIVLNLFTLLCEEVDMRGQLIYVL